MTISSKKKAITNSLFIRSGDPDLFVSHTNYPTYEKHDLSSYSCGDEKIIIEESYPRPIFLSIYCSEVLLEDTAVDACEAELSVCRPDSQGTIYETKSTEETKSITSKILNIIFSILVQTL